MGSCSSTANTKKHSVESHYGKMTYAVSSMQGWRPSMEDSYIACFNIAPSTSIFGVFDGHGGKEIAKYVERHFIIELLKCNAFQNGDYSQALTDTFLKMDELLQTIEGKNELAAIEPGNDYRFGIFAGCTANVALLVNNELYVANSGDSRCIIYSSGEAIALSEDHKPDLEHEKTRIEKAGGFIEDGRVNGNLNLSRSIGDFEYKKSIGLKPGEQVISVVPDIRTRTLTNDDELLILGCDGIWECLPNQQIAEFLYEKMKDEKSVLKAAEDLLDRIVAPDTSTGIGCDNMTIIVVTLK